MDLSPKAEVVFLCIEGLNIPAGLGDDDRAKRVVRFKGFAWLEHKCNDSLD